MVNKFFHKLAPHKNQELPPGQHFATKLPVLTYGEEQEISREEWSLVISVGSIKKTFTIEDLMRYELTNFTADFHCVTHWSKLGVRWSGIRIAEIFKDIVVPNEITHVIQYCYGGYSVSMPWIDFIQKENYLCLKLNGEWLPTKHGGPVRTLFPKLYGWKSAKWVNRIELLDWEKLGFWEQNGYHSRGNPWMEERFSG